VKILIGFFSLVYGVGYFGLGLLFLYVEWVYVSQSFWQILNPLLHLQVIIALLQMPLFWILLICSVGGMFAAVGVDKTKKDMEM